jgi:hypothetical protein
MFQSIATFLALLFFRGVGIVGQEKKKHMEEDEGSGTSGDQEGTIVDTKIEEGA